VHGFAVRERPYLNGRTALAALHSNGLAGDLFVGDLVLRRAALAVETHSNRGA